MKTPMRAMVKAIKANRRGRAMRRTGTADPGFATSSAMAGTDEVVRLRLLRALRDLGV